MRNTDFMNLSLPEGADKIDIEILNSDFTAIENLLEQHAIVETMTLNGESILIGAIGPYIRLQNIDTVQVSIDIGNETFTLASGENMIIRETAENIGIITSGNTHITYFVNPKTYADKGFYTKEKVDELLSKVEGNVEVDAELSDTSENPVQNKVITEQFSHYYTTTETDEKITEKVAEIVAGAPEDFDTLKEMSDWLNQHEDSAATMNSAIQKNTTDIATANTAIQKNKTDIETANENISKNAEDIVTANTNIQKNVDDITATKNDVAINRTTLGTQCKNLLNPDKHTIARCTEVKDGDTYIVTNAGKWSQWYWFVKGKTGQKYILTFEISELTGDSTVNDVYIKDVSTDTSILNFAVRKDEIFRKEFTAVSDGNIRISWCPNNSATDRELSFKVSNYMCRSADITDSTYEPYKPSLQEQINSLIARIETLEGATATTEGGE